ncbi:MAG: 3-mercaptopyruvate sulfurtransferase [Alphaproteobacteria bacterium]|nr:3-mercaptopyruvate sulfurtransferase [Alphaproteobacteria bacterium]
MAADSFGPLVSCDWLANNLNDANLRILDGSHHLPTTGRNARAEYGERHIPGGIFFDIEAHSDPSTDLPHMLPGAEQFGRDMGGLGIANGHKIVVYDTVGATGAARVWWTLRVFGHKAVAVLDGGLPKWLAEGRTVTAAIPADPSASYTAVRDAGLVRSLDQVRANIASRGEQVLDARSAGRFAAREPEPRQGLRGGHIPGSRSLPVTELFNADRTLKTAGELNRLFAAAGIDPERPIVTTCGSGVTASSLALALHVLGRADVAVYDGSWSEWGGRADVPVATGSA